MPYLGVLGWNLKILTVITIAGFCNANLSLIPILFLSFIPFICFIFEHVIGDSC